MAHEVTRRGAVLSLAACVCLVLSAGPVARAQGEGEGVAAEVARARETLAALGLGEAEAKTFADALDEAEAAARAGHVNYGLYRLLRPRTQLAAFAYQRRSAEVSRQGAEAFDREWRRLGPELEAKEKRLAGGRAARESSAVGALVEALLTEVRPQYEAGRLYGHNTTWDSGLYYLGAASANLDYALFLRGLGLTAGGADARRRRPARPLDAELRRLEAETLRAYRRPGTAAQQPRFNGVNSTLKTAWDLNREQRFAGALLKYLDAARLLAQIEADAAPPPAAAALGEKLSAARARLATPGADHGVGLIFWEMARVALDRAQAGAGQESELRRAGVVLDSVLPRYFEYASAPGR